MWEADVLGSCDSFVAQTNECQPEKKSQSMSGQAPTRWTPTTVKAGLIRGLCVFIAALVGACVRTPTVHFVPMIGRADSVFNFRHAEAVICLYPRPSALSAVKPVRL